MGLPSKVNGETTGRAGLQHENQVKLVFDANQKIVSVDGGTNENECLIPEFIGKSFDQIPFLGHFRALILSGFCFGNLPVKHDSGWWLADFIPEDIDKDKSGELILRTVSRGSEAFAVLHDFVQAIDPFSLDAGGGILLVDRDGYILMVNREFAEILDLNISEMIGRHVNETYPDSTLSRLPKVMASGKAEVGAHHQLNGREIVASRWPLMKQGKTYGAYGKAQLREGPDTSRFKGNIHTTESQLLKRTHRPIALYDANQIICQGQTMRELKERMLRVAANSSTVLLAGESGTGKELFAHAIHAASNRSKGPFVRVNCAAIPENLLEAELFGYVEGAFSGSRRGGQIGKFEQAHGGTVFLDEISEMPMTMQAKLLRVLQEREVAPLGSQDIRFVDVRFITATNCDPLSLVKDGKLRSDLYYRINVVSLNIPPLRERPEDIFRLTRYFIDQFNEEFNLNVQGLSSRAWSALKEYPFPGNVRELRSAIESSFNMVDGPFVRLYDLPEPISQIDRPDNFTAPGNDLFRLDAVKEMGKRSLQEIMEEIEKDLIVGAMDKVGGNKLVAANLLGISRPGLYKKLQKYNLQ